MFFKKKGDTDRRTAWDEESLAHFTKAARFEVQITSVTKRSGFGTRERALMHDPFGYEVSGVITFPKLIPVTVNFERNGETFGTWFYNVYDNASAPTGTGIALLELCVGDDNGKIREALYEALKTALLSGRRYTLARFWKREGDGAMTAKDREHGYSYESRYPLFGMHCWSEVEPTTLPNWAVPYGTDTFSLKNLPPWYDLKAVLASSGSTKKQTQILPPANYIILLVLILAVLLFGRPDPDSMQTVFWIGLFLGIVALIIWAIVAFIRFIRRDFKAYRDEVRRDREEGRPWLYNYVAWPGIIGNFVVLAVAAYWLFIEESCRAWGLSAANSVLVGSYSAVLGKHSVSGT
jgi:hypothetical protein